MSDDIDHTMNRDRIHGNYYRTPRTRTTVYEKKLQTEILELKAEVDRLTAEHSEERLIKAAEKAGITYMGCDTPDWLAEKILELKHENTGLREYSESRDESIKVYREEIKELKERLKKYEAEEEKVRRLTEAIKKACEVKE